MIYIDKVISKDHRAHEYNRIVIIGLRRTDCFVGCFVCACAKEHVQKAEKKKLPKEKKARARERRRLSCEMIICCSLFLFWNSFFTRCFFLIQSNKFRALLPQFSECYIHTLFQWVHVCMAAMEM